MQNTQSTLPTQKKKLPAQSKTNKDDECDNIVIDATKYVSIVADDPFHPGQLVNLLIDPASVTSSQLMGYGVLDEAKTPVVRLFYENGTAEDVFDVGHTWATK